MTIWWTPSLWHSVTHPPTPPHPPPRFLWKILATPLVFRNEPPIYLKESTVPIISNFYNPSFLSEMVLWGQNICPWRLHLIRKPDGFILNQKRTRDGLLFVAMRINNARTLIRVENNLSELLKSISIRRLFSYNAFECSARYILYQHAL